MTAPSGFRPRERLAAGVWAGELGGRSVVVKHEPAERGARRGVEHPALLPVLSVGGDEAEGPVVLPRAACSLADLVAARGLLPPEAVVAIALPVAGALVALHGRGVVHGDVHPGNVLLDAAGAPLLADLAGAGPAGPPRVATPGFAAPEVEAGRWVDEASDQWALAATCAAVVRPPVPTPLAVVLAVATAPDPTHRFATVTEMARSLAAAVPPGRLERPGLVPPAPLARPTTRRFGPRPPAPTPARRSRGRFRARGR